MAQGAFHSLPLNSHHCVYERQVSEVLPSTGPGKTVFHLLFSDKLDSLCLSVLICKMELIQMVETSEKYCENQVIAHRVVRTMSGRSVLHTN